MNAIDLVQVESMIDSLIASMQDKFIKEQNLFLEQALRRHAVPPISGEITRGKIQWRGIRLCQKDRGFGFEMWIEQRGKQIGPRIIHEFECNIPGLKK